MNLFKVRQILYYIIYYNIITGDQGVFSPTLGQPQKSGTSAEF